MAIILSNKPGVLSGTRTKILCI